MQVIWIPRHQLAVAARSTAATVNKLSLIGPPWSPAMIGKQTNLSMELRRVA